MTKGSWFAETALEENQCGHLQLGVVPLLLPSKINSSLLLGLAPSLLIYGMLQRNQQILNLLGLQSLKMVSVTTTRFFIHIISSKIRQSRHIIIYIDQVYAKKNISFDIVHLILFTHKKPFSKEKYIYLQS